MCTEGGLGYLNATNAWTCLWFDPLDPSDSTEDIDRCDDFSFGCGDGFDVNRDGNIDVTERYSNSEEYSFGTPENWITERDGLWCSGTIPGMSENSCQESIVRPTEDDGLLVPTLHAQILITTHGLIYWQPDLSFLAMEFQMDGKHTTDLTPGMLVMQYWILIRMVGIWIGTVM